MPSKKKSSRIKARKGSKKEEQQETPDTQMERLKIDDTEADEDALLEEAIKLAAAEKEALEAAVAEEEKSKKLALKHGDGCDHGYVETEDHFIIVDFFKIYSSGFLSVRSGSGEVNILDCFQADEKATGEKYPNVWYDSSKLKLVALLFLFKGTQEVLEGNINNARFDASIAFFFEEYNAVNLHDRKDQAMDFPKMLELSRADANTLVKYLRKNIPCKCLDGKYKEVKSITKMGFCCNEHCQVPGRMVERRTMLYCTRCRAVNYCSPECQKADWPSHKEICDFKVGKES